MPARERKKFGTIASVLIDDTRNAIRNITAKLPNAVWRARQRFSFSRDGWLAVPIGAVQVLGDLSPAIRLLGPHRLPPAFRSGLVGAEIATWGAVSPSLLPHNWWATAANVAVLQGIGHGVATGLAHAFGPTTPPTGTGRLPRPARVAMTATTVAVFATSIRRRIRLKRLVQSDDTFRASDLAGGVMLGTLGYGTVLLVGDAIQSFIDVLNVLLGKKLPPVASWPIAIVGGGVLLVLVSDRVVLRQFLSNASRRAFELDREYMRGAVQPHRPQRSGSPESSVDWNLMGRQGRAVVSGGPRKEDIERVLGREAHEPIRIFVGLDLEREQDEPDFEQMARLAIKEMHRTGAFERSHIAVMSAAGTGWINDFHTSGFEFVTGGDSAIVAMQYSYLPSAYSYLADRTNPVRSSRMLIEYILRELENIPESSRPKLFVGGESLGAYGVSDAFESVDELFALTSGAVFTGTPGFARNHSELTKQRQQGSPERLPLIDDGLHVRFTAHPDHLNHDFQGDAYAQKWEAPRVVFAQHASDPVVWWDHSLAWRRPDWLKEPGSRGVPAPKAQHLDALHTMRWMPLVTYWQIAIDQLSSKDYPSPHGHNYHEETVAYWNGVIHGEDAGEDSDASLTKDEIKRAAAWIHNDATKLRRPVGGFPSKHGY